jgi:diguanylate cyclase (GGDEF)-like protein
MLLDNTTLLFSLMLISSLLAVSLSIVTSKDDGDGLRRWAAALAIEALAWLLIVFRGSLSDILTVAAPNLLLAAAQAIKLAALHAYRRKTISYRQCLLPVAAMALVLAILPFDDVRNRMGLCSLVYALQFLLILRFLWGDTESRSGRAWWLLFASTGLIVPLLFLRAGFSLFGSMEFVATPQSPVAPNPVQIAVFVGLTALNVLGALGFVLMIKEHGDREIRMLAMTDSLTRTLNRRAFLEQADKYIAAALRHRLPLSLLMIDIDHFKRINDSFGHPAGDRVLVEVTKLLTSLLRKEDILARYGGEEFCVLLPNTDEDGALALAEKLRRAVENMHVASEGAALPITISVGLTHCDTLCSTCHKDFASMLQDADRALYLAKQKGRNRIVPLSLSCGESLRTALA